MQKKQFKVWRTLQIGGKIAAVLLTKLMANGFTISDGAQDMMRNQEFATSSEPIKLRLVRVTVLDLGFPEGATVKEIWDRAQSINLGLCPAETGPYLRLAHHPQSKDGFYWIGMEPISDSGGYPLVFGVGHVGGGPWLASNFARPECRWRLGDRIVFVAPDP